MTATTRRRGGGQSVATARPMALLALSVMLLLLSPAAAFFAFLVPRRVLRPHRNINRPVSSPTTARRRIAWRRQGLYAVQQEEQQEEKDLSLLEQPLPLPLASAKEEIAAGAVAAMAMWEVIRELDRRQVVYNVLQPREELNRLLLEARLGSGGGAALKVPQHEEDAPKPVAKEEKEIQKSTVVEATLTEELPKPPLTPSPLPLPHPVVQAAAPGASPAAGAKTMPPTPPGPSKSTSRFRPQPALAAATVPVFGSIAEALAWAGKLSEEEMRVELEFLNVKEETTHLSYSELARLLARSVLIEGGARGREDRSTRSSREPPLTPAATSVAGIPIPAAKSKARQNRLLQRQQGQQQQRAEGAAAAAAAGPVDGGEDHPHLDIEHAREELTALRSRALDAVVAIGGNPERTDKAAGRPSSAAAARGSRSSRGGGDGKQRPRSKTRSPQEVWLNEAYDGARFSEGGDLALRFFEKATRTADMALDWATRAKNSAKGAMIAATISDEDTAPLVKGGKGKGEGNSKKAALQKKSQKLLGPRGRRWSKLTGLMARAWAESAWQVVMASASWAGGGLLPGKYVLLGAGVFALLLRQGLGTYMATLLVVRTCSSTLRNMIEDDDEMEAEAF